MKVAHTTIVTDDNFYFNYFFKLKIRPTNSPLRVLWASELSLSEIVLQNRYLKALVSIIVNMFTYSQF